MSQVSQARQTGQRKAGLESCAGGAAFYSKFTHDPVGVLPRRWLPFASYGLIGKSRGLVSRLACGAIARLCRLSMTLVRIVKSWDKPDLLRQTPGGAGVWNDIRFTLDPVGRCDYLVILNRTPLPLLIEVPPENIWCFIQEPPLPANRHFEKGFRHFHRVFTQDPRLRGPRCIQAHGSLPWLVDRTYDQLAAMPWPVKTRDLVWITSDAGSSEGQRQRLQFLERLRVSGPSFDLFGRGFTPVPDKWDALAPSRYALAVENCGSADYWTEKVADCFLAGAMPIYFGATNLAAWFPAESFVWLDINDPAAPRRVAEIVRSPLAEKQREAVAEARRRVLDEHNLFPRIAGLIAADRTGRTAPALPQAIAIPGLRESSVPVRAIARLGRLWRK